MSVLFDPEQMMIDALDGTINDRDFKVLQAYLVAHPEERALFERMQSVDQAMRLAPVAVPPVAMTRQIMGAVSRVNMARPALRTAHIALLICITTVLVVLAGLIVLGLYMVLSAIVPADSVQAIVTFMTGVLDVIMGIYIAAVAFTRAVFSQPIAWVVALGLVAVVAGWLRVMVAVLVPGLHQAPASA